MSGDQLDLDAMLMRLDDALSRAAIAEESLSIAEHETDLVRRERDVRAETSEARLGAVIALHSDDDGTCAHDGDDWPCPTYRAANTIPAHADEMRGHWRDSFGARWDRLVENGP